MFHAFILGMDSFALGLINAAKIIEDGRLDEFIKNRYSSFDSDLGKKILSENASLEELSKIAENLGKTEEPQSGRQEYLRSILNSVLFG